MKDKFKNINFKQKKYLLPLLVFPIVLFIGWTIGEFMDEQPKKEVKEVVGVNIDMNSKKTQGEVKTKEDSYKAFFNTRETEGRSRITNLKEEVKKEETLGSNYSASQQRMIDSLDQVREAQDVKLAMLQNQAQEQKHRFKNEEPTEEEVIEALNLNAKNSIQQEQPKEEEKLADQIEDLETQQMRILKNQMMFLDSLEKMKDPNYKYQKLAEDRMKKLQQEKQDHLDSRLEVRKERDNSQFNDVFKNEKNDFIQAVIDQDIKTYLGSRIRIRLLESIYIGEHKLKKGTYLYATVSGFTLQRVELRIVSVMFENSILPITLDIFDNDGMKGLYVPSSIFRQITKDIGGTIVGGQNIQSSTSGSLTEALVNQAFTSSTKALSNLIKKNKAKLKFNTHIYLIDTNSKNR